MRGRPGPAARDRAGLRSGRRHVRRHADGTRRVYLHRPGHRRRHDAGRDRLGPPDRGSGRRAVAAATERATCGKTGGSWPTLVARGRRGQTRAEFPADRHTSATHSAASRCKRRWRASGIRVPQRRPGPADDLHDQQAAPRRRPPLERDQPHPARRRLDPHADDPAGPGTGIGPGPGPLDVPRRSRGPRGRPVRGTAPPRRADRRPQPGGQERQLARPGRAGPGKEDRPEPPPDHDPAEHLAAGPRQEQVRHPPREPADGLGQRDRGRRRQRQERHPDRQVRGVRAAGQAARRLAGDRSSSTTRPTAG